MSLFGQNKSVSVTKQNSPPTSPNNSAKQQRLSQSFAIAAAHVEDLEHQLQEALERNSILENRLRVSEAELAAAKLRVDALETQNDSAREHNARIMGKLEAVANVLIECLPRKPLKSETQSLAAVSDAIAAPQTAQTENEHHSE